MTFFSLTLIPSSLISFSTSLRRASRASTPTHSPSAASRASTHAQQQRLWRACAVHLGRIAARPARPGRIEAASERTGVQQASARRPASAASRASTHTQRRRLRRARAAQPGRIAASPERIAAASERGRAHDADEPSRRPASARRERALAVAAERGGGRRAHGAGEPSRPPASARCGRALTAAPRPAPRPRRQAPRQPRPSTAAARPDAVTPAPASRAAPRPRRPDAGLPERHDRRARSRGPPSRRCGVAGAPWPAGAGARGRDGARPPVFCPHGAFALVASR